MNKWFHEEHIVEFYECDPSKTVYNSKYFIWFERARFKIAEEVELSSYVERLKRENNEIILFPVLEAECKFTLPIPLGKHLIIRTKLEKPKVAKLVFKHVVTDIDTGVEYAKATTVVGILSSKNGLMINLNNDVKKLINNYLNS